MSERGDMNAALLTPDTMSRRGSSAHRGTLKIAGKYGDELWWACKHAHATATEAYDCALKAREQVRNGRHLHELIGATS